jgi:hypothetical protein
MKIDMRAGSENRETAKMITSTKVVVMEKESE